MKRARLSYSETGGAPTHKKGRAAEIRVADFLKHRGFVVALNTKIRGPDLLVTVGCSLLSVEVKSAVRYVRHGKYEFWLSEKVSSPRRHDDIVAVVAPDGRVLLDTMAYHLLLCRKDGRRNVTEFVKGKK